MRGAASKGDVRHEGVLFAAARGQRGEHGTLQGAQRLAWRVVDPLPQDLALSRASKAPTASKAQREGARAARQAAERLIDGAKLSRGDLADEGQGEVQRVRASNPPA